MKKTRFTRGFLALMFVTFTGIGTSSAYYGQSCSDCTETKVFSKGPLSFLKKPRVFVTCTKCETGNKIIGPYTKESSATCDTEAEVSNCKGQLTCGPCPK